MKPATTQQTSIKATLCEIERGLFYTTYPGREREATLLELPIYALGRDVSEVKRQMEKSLFGLGYKAVIWQELAVLPILTQQGMPSKRRETSSAASLQGVTWAPGFGTLLRGY